jgi:hypothetical protein
MLSPTCLEDKHLPDKTEIKGKTETTDPGLIVQDTDQIHQAETMETKTNGLTHQTEMEDVIKGRLITTETDPSLHTEGTTDKIEADPCPQDIGEMTTTDQTTARDPTLRTDIRGQIHQQTATDQTNREITGIVLPLLTNKTGRDSLKEQTRSYWESTATPTTTSLKVNYAPNVTHLVGMTNQTAPTTTIGHQNHVQPVTMGSTPSVNA